MRPINFVIIFAVCLALVLFSLENTQPVVIQVVQGTQVQAPLCIVLILAMGIGAILAWLFSLWNRFLRLLQSREEIRQRRQKDERIQELEQDLDRYKAELEQHHLPPGSNAVTDVTQEAQIIS